MISNIMVIDIERDRMIRYPMSVMQVLDIVILVDKPNGLFWYDKNRYMGFSGREHSFPLSDFDAHMRIIEAIRR